MATDDASPARPALSFGGVAEAYDRGRPGYPRDAAAWLAGDRPLSVLELGAGTGRLTEQLVALGHDVHATDPDPRMLDRLAARLPELRVSQTTAEEIPAADASFDVVLAADSYEWFDHERALPEIARVLKRGGSLGVVRNVRDERIPWVKRLGNLVGHHVAGAGVGEELEASPYFGPVEVATFKQWHVIDRSTVQDMVRSIAEVAVLDATGQEAKVREVLDFYDDFGRGMDGMQLPYVTECYRAVVGIRPQPRPEARPASADDGADAGTGAGVGADAGIAGATGAHAESVAASSSPAVDPPTDDDSGVLLIDFR
ncbi:class I SAM-dependent methyltransferase [Nocardioides sp. SYSU DS0651]|uniref:class I SAM-dependent methyltransferase n=1 Tax=Nocardioides sp. SYSU DS0651 TaxID=3415955 RepID=UPI003F4BA228